MIAVDSSAIVSIVKAEAGCERIQERLGAGPCVIAAPTMLEIKMVLSSVTDAASVDLFFRRIGSEAAVEVVDFTPAMADAAVAAFRLYGKGRGHPAQLNFGDCMAYGTAKALDLPLLYKGGDFALTDIRPALA